MTIEIYNKKCTIAKNKYVYKSSPRFESFKFYPKYKRKNLKELNTENECIVKSAGSGLFISHHVGYTQTINDLSYQKDERFSFPVKSYAFGVNSSLIDRLEINIILLENTRNENK